MSYVIDQRLNGKNKSTLNRQRFLRRYRSRPDSRLRLEAGGWRLEAGGWTKKRHLRPA